MWGGSRAVGYIVVRPWSSNPLPLFSTVLHSSIPSVTSNPLPLFSALFYRCIPPLVIQSIATLFNVTPPQYSILHILSTATLFHVTPFSHFIISLDARPVFVPFPLPHIPVMYSFTSLVIFPSD